MDHFGVGAPPILVHFSGGWDVHWGYGILTHGQVDIREIPKTTATCSLLFQPSRPNLPFRPQRCDSDAGAGD